ncbi:MAG: DUF2202 domain-containing protein [Anaerolineae bacterium]|nr:DUF2202 domain-containing protein [Anaerolineae bacterium]
MKGQRVWQNWWMVSALVLVLLSGCASETKVAVPESVTLAPNTATVELERAAVTPELLTVSAEGATSIETVALEAALSAVPVTELSDAETAGLLLMREEEKLAQDVYLALYDLWGQPVFQNIASSEATHTAAVLTLLERYGIADPVGDNAAGVFTDPELQALYDDLVAQGSESLIAALRVGAAVEEIDILDLEELSAQTDKADILTVYANLTKGSRNHLRAFVRTLEQRGGESYVPQYMNQEDFDAIIASGVESGGVGNNGAIGNRGNRGGRGNGRG